MDTITATKVKNVKPMSKTKIKKTIKNIVCRPDPLNWLIASDEEKRTIETVLQKHKVHIQEFKKPHWNDVKDIPKEKRPKPPKYKKVEGLIFGISDCKDAIQNSTCSGILIEAEINPKMLIEPVLEQCSTHFVPYLCIKGLRKTCSINFGIPTSCLGVKKGQLLDIEEALSNIYSKRCKPNFKESIVNTEVKEEPMVVDEKVEETTYPYLHRNHKNTRVFVPAENAASESVSHKFTGQNFIELTGSKNVDRKSYMNMILKRISNNPNREKSKKS